jgi:hypothetical protein
MPYNAIHAVFQATIEAKLSYAAPAWWGYTSVCDRDRTEAFLRRSVQQGYRSASSPTFAELRERADDKLFKNITDNERHLLYQLLPPKRHQQYYLRQRSHNFQIPNRTSTLNDNNFITRMFFKDITCFVQPTTE